MLLILTVETNDYCFERSSFELLVAPLLYRWKYHSSEPFWNHGTNISRLNASEFVQCSWDLIVLAERSICQQTTSRKWFQLWSPGRNLPNTALKSSSYFALYSSLCRRGKNFAADNYPSFFLLTAQDTHVKLTVFDPKNFLRAEAKKINTSGISVRGKKMQSLLNKKTTDGIGCNFKCTWEYEKQNPLGTSLDTEKALFLFQRLVELEKSYAPFKATVISFIELLRK